MKNVSLSGKTHAGNPRVLCSKLLIAGLLGAVSALEAQSFTETCLNDSAVRDGSGNLIVYGASAANAGVARENAFDGDTATFYENADVRNVCGWVGLGMPTPKILTKVRYFAGNGSSARMRQCLVQGANREDFSDAVTLHVLNPPSDWKGTSSGWTEERVTLSAALTQTWRYFRLYAPNHYVDNTWGRDYGTCGGNVAELEFYGGDRPGTAVAPPVPSVDFADVINGYANFRVMRDAGVDMYDVVRRYDGESEWVSLATIMGKTSAAGWIRAVSSTSRAARYKVRAITPDGVSEVAYDIPVSYALVGTQFGYGSAGGTYGYSTVFDGNPATFYDSAASTSWAGLDFGVERTITAVRYVKREGGDGPRIRNAKFQVANQPDFSDAVTFYVAPDVTPDFAVVTATLATPVVGRYARYHTPENGYGNIAECEFDTDAHPVETPSDFTVSPSDWTNHHAVLSWVATGCESMSSTLVYRAVAETGPWSRVAVVGTDVTSWTDTSLRVGERFWYAVGYGRLSSGELLEGMTTRPVVHRRLMRIERDWADLSQLKPGMSVIHNGTYGGSYSPSKMFDGDPLTFADMLSPSGGDKGDIRVGVDFGKAYCIGAVRALPRQDADGRNRAPGHLIYGANSIANWAEANVVVPAMSFDGLAWGEFASADETGYRYAWINKPTTGSSYANFAELEFYGWPTDILVAPEKLTFAMEQTGVRVRWAGCAVAEKYRVERRNGTQGDWVSCGTTTEQCVLDTSAARDGSECFYRVFAIAGSDEIASGEFRVVPYAPGAGTGLNGVYTWPWTRDGWTAPTAVVTNLDRQLDFDWGAGALIGGMPDATSRVHVTWTGKLIVPYDGYYAFAAEVKDWLTLVVDGNYLINAWGDGNPGESVGLTLTAGEHDLRVEYANDASPAHMRLKWSGRVAEEVIPMSQLVPVVPAGTAWEGNRSFNCLRQGAAEIDGNAIRIGGAYRDLDNSINSYHYLWRSWRGDFDCRMHVKWIGSGCKVMLMARASLDPLAPMIAPILEFGQSYSYGVKRRVSQGGANVDVLSPAWTSTGVTSGWLRLQRRGNDFTCLWKADGGQWQTLGVYTCDPKDFGPDVVIGPAGCCSFSTSVVTPLFHEVTDFSLRPIQGLMVIVR